MLKPRPLKGNVLQSLVAGRGASGEGSHTDRTRECTFVGGGDWKVEGDWAFLPKPGLPAAITLTPSSTTTGGGTAGVAHRCGNGTLKGERVEVRRL